MRILITGAAGFLGRIIVERLRPEHELTLVDRVPGSVGARELDVTDLAAVREAARGHDAVIHCVALVRGRDARPLEDYVQTMVLGTWCVAEACALEGVKTLVNISSVVAEGFPSSRDRQRQLGDPPVFAPGDRFYAISKHLGEAIVNAYATAYKLRVLNLRPGILAGDGQNGEPQRPKDGGRYWFAHVDPTDVADGVARALESDASGTYHMVATRPDSLWEWERSVRDFGYVTRQKWEGV